MQCLVSFGSNLGDRRELIAEAARRLSESDVVLQGDDGTGLKTSRLFETPPIGGPDGQEPFLNAVAAFETTTPAREILTLLQWLENELGRQRRRRWDARSIDLDVVLHGQLVGGGTGLIVPHPRYTARQFVLRPACDVAADYRDPRFGWTIEKLADHLDAGLPSMALVGGDLATRQKLCQLLEKNHHILTFAARSLPEPMEIVGNSPVANPKSELQRLLDKAAEEDRAARTAEGWSEHGEPIIAIGDQPWVSAYLPKLPSLESDATTLETTPRLVARMHHATPETSWPAPHQMWPGGWQWPEYRLEIDDIDWAASEIASAMQSMRCDVTPVTPDGRWW